MALKFCTATYVSTEHLESRLNALSEAGWSDIQIFPITSSDKHTRTHYTLVASRDDDLRNLNQFMPPR